MLTACSRTFAEAIDLTAFRHDKFWICGTQFIAMLNHGSIGRRPISISRICLVWGVTKVKSLIFKIRLFVHFAHGLST